MQKTLFIAAFATALMSSTAMAADFGVINQAAPAAFEPASAWTGFYAGVFGGVGGGQSALTFTPPGFPGFDISGNSFGGLLGVQAGADYQMGSFVVGAVADIAMTNISVGNDIGGGGILGIGYESPLDFFGTVRARAGFLPTDNLLAYVHGGLAYGQTSPQLIVPAGVVGPDLEAAGRVGFTVGAGFEYKLTENISLQTEYAYTDFGTADVDYTPSVGFPAGASFTEQTSFHTVKAGLNYRF